MEFSVILEEEEPRKSFWFIWTRLAFFVARCYC